MPAYRLTNVGQHIAQRLWDPQYIKKQGTVKVVNSNSVFIISPRTFAASTLASQLKIQYTSPEFLAAMDIMKEALFSGAINDGSEELNLGLFNQMLESGLFVEGTRLGEEPNPIESIRVINFQVTLNCNLSCLHCSRGNASTEHEPIARDVLADALEQAYLSNAMCSFAVNGGEPTLFKGDLFWLFKFAATLGVVTQFVTNGWWGDKQDFTIWGHKFKNAGEFTDKLRAIAPMFVHFSLDGTEAIHDHLRQKPGSFNSAIAGIKAARESGLIVNTNTVKHPDLESFEDLMNYLEANCGLNPDPREMNLSAMVRTGQAANNFPVTDPIYEEEYLDGCKGFYSPTNLVIGYDGKLGSCGVASTYGEFGDLKIQTMTEILNGIQETAAYQLHVGKDLKPHLHLLPEDIFPIRYSNPCEMWIPLTMIVTKIDQEEKRLGRKLFPQEIRAIQEYVGWRTMLGKSENPFS